jgi:hypothetical protein
MENMEALVSGINDGAASRGLKMLAATIPGDPDVLFRHPDVALDDALDVARHVSAPFLTLTVSTLDPARLTERPGFLGEITHAGVPPEDLRRRWQERSGEIDCIFLEWIAAGTRYAYMAAPEWAGELEDARNAWFEEQDNEDSDLTGALWARIAALAERLEADPGYRAGNQQTRRDIGRAFLEPLVQSSEGEFVVHKALEEAGKLVRANAQAAYGALLGDMDALIADLRDTAEWKAARKQYQMEAAARDFLQERCGGYAPQAKTVGVFVKQALK